MLAAVAVGHVMVRAEDRPSGLATDIALVWALSVVAAWPILFEPIHDDTIPLRIAFSRFAVFGDWNHPPLSYILNQPARMSLEPHIVRLAPLLWFLVQSAMAMVLAGRLKDRRAGVLVGVWLACETRRRAGISDLGDWDLAGCFLLGMALWLQGEERPRAAWLVGVLALGGMASSWLMVAVVCVLAVVLWADRLRGVVGWGPPVIVSTLLAAVALPMAEVLKIGGEIRGTLGPADLPGLPAAIWHHWPPGRDVFMAVPVVVGVGWLARHHRESWARFTLGTLLAVVVAVGAASRVASVNGSYYAGLATPILLVVGAAAMVAAIDWMSEEAPSTMAPTALAAVAFATVSPTRFDSQVDLWTLDRIMPELTDRFVAEPVTVVTNQLGLRAVLSFELARRGEAYVEEVLPRGTVPLPADAVVEQRMHLIRCVDCLAQPDCVEQVSGSLVVLERRNQPPDELACTEALVAGCEPLHGDRIMDDVFVVDCR